MHKKLAQTSQKKTKFIWMASEHTHELFSIILSSGKHKTKIINNYNNEKVNINYPPMRTAKILLLYPGEDVENRTSHIFLMGVKSGTTTKHSCMVFYKDKHTTYHMTQQFHLGIWPRGKNNICSYRDIYSNIHSSFLNGQKLKIIQMFFNWYG